MYLCCRKIILQNMETYKNTKSNCIDYDFSPNNSFINQYLVNFIQLDNQ